MSGRRPACTVRTFAVPVFARALPTARRAGESGDRAVLAVKVPQVLTMPAGHGTMTGRLSSEMGL